MEIGLNSVDRDETEVKEDIKKKGKKEELEDLENKVEITQQVSAKQPPLSCFALSNIIVLFRFAIKAARLPLPARNLQRCTAPQNRFKIAVQLNYSCSAAF